ncbi:MULTISPECIES: DUF1501 domain-containing protein [unclassified Lentimonas]|uniref:DUF1501 domain-containing protein n=1 Tax=unclassified Lentimonas TaxID=2630993 RepID=UPI001322EA90|nr:MULTISPECIES: DUF1501 domain-containing protein [unclassified Lentimonas]CAA6690033.1 Unannotated [Lentimonas sp. CC10]CAA6691109.1 Unannotated [Lentimonas sp. CC19]CAA7069278.1 Unannotated [Lentimonas sp. CC11]
MKKSFLNKGLSRRKFLGDCGKMTSIGALSSILNMSMMNRVLAARASGSITDYKAVVCVFLAGGNDSFNMLIPGNYGYDDYAASRQQLALSKESMHFVVDRSKIPNKGYYLHGELAAIKDMFNAGDLSFISNVGTLVEPLSFTEFMNKTKRIPIGIGSHSDQQTQWQTSIPQSPGGSGWMGRMADILNDAANNDAYVSMGIAPGGNNIAQTGTSGGPFSLANGVNTIDAYENKAHIESVVNSQLEYNYANVLQEHHEYVRKNTIEQSKILKSLIDQTTISTIFPNTGLGNQLLMIAKCIKIQGITGLNMNRQTFFAKHGGYDHHSNVLINHAGKMSDLNASLSAFNEALKEIGYHDKVIAYTASDFGRTLASNGSGSGHGWGGNQIIMGGPISGKRVFGEYPNLALGSTTAVSAGGRQLPTTSVDELHSSIAQWYGVTNDSEMETLLPNIRNFHASGAITDYAIPELFTS